MGMAQEKQNARQLIKVLLCKISNISKYTNTVALISC